MSKFRKKPVVIDAVRWTGDNPAEIEQFCPVCRISEGTNVLIPTLEGRIYGSKGDWIIKGVAGEFYPCKPDIFAATYEEVKGDDTE